MKEIISAFIMPPFSLVLILIVGWLVQRRNERVGRLLFTLGAVVSILIFMPITGKVAIQPLLHAVKPWVPGDPIMPEVVLIPTGGAFEDQDHRWWPNNYSVSRMTSGLDLHKRYGLPLIISGGPMPGSQDSEAKLLVRFFNLEETADIRLEQHSRTTYDTARNVAQLLRPAGVKVVFLVTTDVHMTRMAASLRHQGLQILGRPFSPMVYEYTWWDAVPKNSGLSIWNEALNEYLAIAWYLATGKISIADFQH